MTIPNRYPDDVLLHIVLEQSQDDELQRQVKTSFDLLLSQLTPAA